MPPRKAFRAPSAAKSPRPALRAPEIDLLIAIEGRAPAAAVQAAARRFGMSPGTARSWINRLRKREMLRTVAVVDRSRCGALVETVAHIRVDWSHPAAADLETVLHDDPAVTQAARTCGPFDYTAFAIHDNLYAAAAWSREIQSRPWVSGCRVDRMQTRFKRFPSAALLLKPADQQ